MQLIIYFFGWFCAYSITKLVCQFSPFGFLKDWNNSKDSTLFAMSLMSYFHSTHLCYICIRELSFKNGFDLTSNFTIGDINIITFSLSYFFYDLYHVYRLKSYMFLVHHSLSILFIWFFFYLNFSTIILMNLLISEFTTPLLNVWILTKEKKYPIFYQINGFFTYFYIFIRGIILPIFTIYSMITMYNEEKMHKVFFYLLSCMGMVINVGNLLWSKNLFIGYLKWKKKQSEKKTR